MSTAPPPPDGPVDLVLLPRTAAVGPDGRLSVGGCDLVELAETYGTPLFVYDEAHLRAACREAVDHRVYLRPDGGAVGGQLVGERVGLIVGEVADQGDDHEAAQHGAGGGRALGRAQPLRRDRDRRQDEAQQHRQRERHQHVARQHERRAHAEHDEHARREPRVGGDGPEFRAPQAPVPWSPPGAAESALPAPRAIADSICPVSF